MSATSAIYHLHFHHVARPASSATASLAYMVGQALRSVYDHEVKRPGIKRAHRVLKSEIMLPDTAPKEWEGQGFEFIAAQVEMAEKAKNARPAATLDVALPRGMNWEEREAIVREFISANFTAHGYVAAYALHQDKDDHNPHAHIWVSERRLGQKGWLSKTKSEYALDENGNRIPVIDPTTGKQKLGARNQKQWKRVKVSQNLLSEKRFLLAMRKSWADCLNAHLQPELQVSEKSLKEQGKVAQSPTIHEGYAARQIEARGGVSERCQINRKIRQLNEQNANVLARLKQLTSEIRDLVRDQLRAKLVEPVMQQVAALRENLFWLQREKNLPQAVSLREKISLAREKYFDLQQAGIFAKHRAQREFEEAWSSMYQALPLSVKQEILLDAPREFMRWDWLEKEAAQAVKNAQVASLESEITDQQEIAAQMQVPEVQVTQAVENLDQVNPIYMRGGEWRSRKLDEMRAEYKPVEPTPQPMPQPVQKPIQQPAGSASEQTPVSLGKRGIRELIQQRLRQQQDQPQQPQKPAYRPQLRR